MGRKEATMKNERKRNWTPRTALDYVGQVESGKAVRGLKYCSAMSYIRKVSEKAIVKRA